MKERRLAQSYGGGLSPSANIRISRPCREQACLFLSWLRFRLADQIVNRG